MIRKLRPRLMEIGVFSLIVLLLCLGTYSRNQLWNDEIGLWTDCVKKSPGKARPYANLGYACLISGIYDRALEWTQKAIQIDPKFANAYYNLSIIYQKLGDLPRAIEAGKKSLEIDPDLEMAYYSLGGIYFEKGQYEEAEAAYKKFLQVYPYFPNVHHLLGIVYALQKRFDKAIPEFLWEIRINPTHSLAHLNLGQIFWYEFRNRQKALYHLKTALMVDPLLPNRNQIQRLVRLIESSAS